jgi:hypothetical protein
VKDFLTRFGGLWIKHPHAKVKEKTDYFHFDAIKAINSIDSGWVLEEYSDRVNKDLCIIGEAFRRSLILCMSPDGHVYAGIDESLFLVGESGELAIETLCMGHDLKAIPEQENDEVMLLEKELSKFFMKVPISNERSLLNKYYREEQIPSLYNITHWFSNNTEIHNEYEYKI